MQTEQQSTNVAVSINCPKANNRLIANQLAKTQTSAKLVASFFNCHLKRPVQSNLLMRAFLSIKFKLSATKQTPNALVHMYDKSGGSHKFAV